MPTRFIVSEQTLLETAAGRAVIDALVQSNLDPHTVPRCTVDRMLLEETQRRVRFGGFGSDEELF